MPAPAADRVQSAVRAALAPHERIMLAVSGGVDSLVLLDAAHAVARGRVVAVATFDHGSGAHATEAVAHVERECGERGVRVIVGRATSSGPATEAAWRAARWRFLGEAAERLAARVATAHTEDDQVETVLMRALRGAGARGLAALAARSPVVRPLLAVSRADVMAYARERGVRWVEDPANRSRAYLRNRVRLDILPAMGRVHPEIRDELLTIGARAAAWRAEVEALVAGMPARFDARGALHVALECVIGYDPASLDIVWPALVARAGVALDRRGTRRLAEFTRSAVAGQCVQLSGGFEVARRRDAFVLRRARRAATVDGANTNPVPLTGTLDFGRWRFRAMDANAQRRADDPWLAALPLSAPLAVRAWRPGDRMQEGQGRAARRVKRYLADARIPADERAGWPVVVAGDVIVWIPGVRRMRAATDRSGRPGPEYACERIEHD